MSTRQTAFATASLALFLFVPGCGGTKDPVEAMHGGDFAGAAKLYEDQLAASKPVEDAWVKAKLGHIESTAHIDPKKAAAEASALLKEQGKALGERKLCAVADSLAHGGAQVEALNFLNETVADWPDSLDLDSTHSQIFQNAKKSGAKGLEGLGYASSSTGPFKPRKDSKTSPDKFPKS